MEVGDRVITFYNKKNMVCTIDRILTGNHERPVARITTLDTGESFLRTFKFLTPVPKDFEVDYSVANSMPEEIKKQVNPNKAFVLSKRNVTWKSGKHIGKAIKIGKVIKNG